MKRAVVASLLFLLSCRQETVATTETVDTREPIGVWYVGTPELPVHAKPDEKAEVLATYQNGEAMSVLGQKGDWAEVRTGVGSGWAKMADLTTAAGKKELDENPQPKFRIMPLPVTAPSAHGEIYIEADVNSDGEVISTRLIVNTTGSAALASQNANTLMSAKFYPIIQNNERKPFKYYHRVTY
jgi:uncharacterized protein YgiM (DUF1202 family)